MSGWDGKLVAYFYIMFTSLFFIIFALIMFFEFVFMGKIPFAVITIPLLIGFVIGESIFTFFIYLKKYRDHKLYNIAMKMLMSKINEVKNENI